MRRRALVALAVLFALVLLGAASRSFLRGLSLVIRAADWHGVVRGVANLDTVSETEQLVQIPLRAQSVRARVYRPAGVARQTALLVAGLHPAGIDEPRLVALSRELAETNAMVVTPEIPELLRFEVTPAITDAIEQSAIWLVNDSGLTHDRRIGLMGISFSGGLSIVAAGRSSLAGRISFIFSFGGHDDLPDVIRYLCTGIEPPPPGGVRPPPSRGVRLQPGLEDKAPPVKRPPHDYGVAVILLGIADRLVPADQAEPLRAAVRRFLWASHLDRVDKPEADREFAALRDLAKQLPEPSATLLGYVNDRDVVHLGARLLPYVGAYGESPALSPSRSPKPSAPVFLLHGTDDNVIPAVESERLADDLRGHAAVRLLLTDLVSHAEADRPVHVGDVIKLAAFWGDLLAR